MNISSTEFANPVNLDKKDGDPRKFVFVRHLMQEYPDALDVWRNLGLMERVPSEIEGLTKRKHNAMEHMMAGTGACEALGKMLIDRGVLDLNDVHEIGEAFMVHDAGKDLETQMVIMATEENATWESMTEPTKNVHLIGMGPQLRDLRENYGQYFTPASDKGTRIHVTRDLVVGPIHKRRLIEEGVTPEVVEIGGAAEYSACPEMEDIIDNLNKLTRPAKKMAIKKLVLHWADDIMSNSVMTPLAERAIAVFQKPTNKLLSEAYRKFNNGGESAEEIQIRVGKKVEEALSKLAGIKNPSNLLPTVKQKLQERIEGK